LEERANAILAKVNNDVQRICKFYFYSAN